jgi:hypothetical protein
MRRLGGYEPVHGFRVLPLAASAQRKMALNDRRSPDLLNVRRQPHFRMASNIKQLVELTGIEPVTSCLQSRRSPN